MSAAPETPNANGEESPPNTTIDGNTRSNESPRTTTTPPSRAVPAPQQQTTIGVEIPRKPKIKQRLQDFLWKTFIYSQNIQGCGRNTQQKIEPYKLEYITSFV